ncbi:MAG: Rieske (2Fe-2S) protein [Candidatus Hodarchaeales archaeon]|jgi:3-phenylpropionate/trans-cinnamate dioxygenase ferredoxin subunit
MDRDWVLLGKLSNFPENECVFLEETPLGAVIVIQHQGRYNVLSGICSHEDYELDDAPLNGNKIMCPLHFSQFDILTGEPLDPPAEEPLEVFDVKVLKEQLWIRNKK